MPLLLATLLALLAANTAFAPAYTFLQNFTLLGHTATYWVNDALMPLFFLLVGLEIKREFLTGHLATWRQRALPGLAALGGMLVPAAIFLALNHASPATQHGWAIPTATDIAFALTILALVPRVPTSLKIFLTALAILDDLGAILLIAAFYTSQLALMPLALAALLLAALCTFNRHRVTVLWPYLATGALLWVCVYQSGIHPTIAGVLLALTIPLKSLPKLEHALTPLTTWLILPLFAFFNAGISLAGLTPEHLLHPLTVGIFLGLFLGKQLGVGGALWLASKTLRLPLPHGATLPQLYATTLLCGIGFTMSLFIGNLAFTGPEFTPHIRLGILATSTLSALAALLILTASRRA